MLKYIKMLFVAAVLFAACNKESFTNNPNAYLYADLPEGGDTLSFDTVFTSVGSVTKSFMIKNVDSKSIHIGEIRLAGGENSYFKINVNGAPGTDFNNIDLAAGDSLYVFVAVNIDPTNASNPFVVSDSIGYAWNGNQKFVQLKAYGQNAVFLNAQTISHDTTWTNALPVVLLGNTTVAANATLTIQKGTKVYSHAKTIFEVDGKLLANGGADAADRILFTNDRLDDPYNEATNQWRGINFGASSTGNILNNVTVKNAYVGIADTLSNSPQASPRLALNGCILSNHDYAALYLRNSRATVTNSLIVNSNVQAVLENGGNYSFNYCTIAGYSNDYVSHGNPSLIVDDNPQTGAASALQATFTNCIVYGDNSQTDEIETNANGQSNFSVNFNYGIYKSNTVPAGVTFSNSIQNADPQFMLIDGLRNRYDFSVQNMSPAIGTATPNAVITDILGQSRDAQKPTVGCYEFKN